MIDLRSDTLTLPTREMLDAITTAPLGDDGRVGPDGRGEDPTINRLLDRAIEITGKEAALMLPTGTMGNLTAMMTYASFGESVAVSQCNHIKRSEKGVFNTRPGGVKAELFDCDKFGYPQTHSLVSVLEKGGIKAVCTENTNNFCGGTCITIEQLKELHKLCLRYEVPLHMDGARIFNAAAALGVEVDEIIRNVDSVMFCISKGLRAPVGSLLCGSADFINEARNNAKLCGGIMRQAGVIAAAGLTALNDPYSVALRDNNNAKLLGERIASAHGCLSVDIDTVQSNMVKVNTARKASEIIEDLKSEGVKVGSVDDTSFRLVTHADNTDEDISKAAEIIAAYSIKNK